MNEIMTTISDGRSQITKWTMMENNNNYYYYYYYYNYNYNHNDDNNNCDDEKILLFDKWRNSLIIELVLILNKNYLKNINYKYRNGSIKFKLNSIIFILCVNYGLFIDF